jgi:hypothetical protein
MKRESEALAQLGFALGHPGAYLVGEELSADAQSGGTVPHPVGGEGLGGATRADDGVHAGAGAGHEPEPASHATLS